MRGAPLIAAALLVGCVQLTDADPVGSSASISGQWTIDGAAAGTFNCGRLGADRVRVTFVDEARPVIHGGLLFQCNVTRPSSDERGFDTRDANGAVVGAGCWTVRLDALDSSGMPVALGPTLDVAVPGEDVDLTGCAGAMTTHIELPPTDFLSARVVAATTLGGSRASEMGCADDGIEEVRIVFDDVGGGRVDALGEIGVSSVAQPCELGRVGARILPGHTYTAHLETVDSAGAVTQGASQTFEATESGTVCYFGGRCVHPCNNESDCDTSASETCTNGLCQLPGEPAIPEVALGSL